MATGRKGKKSSQDRAQQRALGERADRLLTAAEEAVERGEGTEALKILRECTRLRPGHLRAGLLLAELLEAAEGPEQARAVLERLYGLGDRHPLLLDQMVRLREMTDSPGGALALARRLASCFGPGGFHDQEISRRVDETIARLTEAGADPDDDPEWEPPEEPPDEEPEGEEDELEADDEEAEEEDPEGNEEEAPTAPEDDPRLLLEPPSLPPIEPSLELTVGPGRLLERLGGEGAPDPILWVDLATRAQEIAQLRSYDRLFAVDRISPSRVREHQLDSVRRALHDCRGKAILADEPGTGPRLEALLSVHEALARGLTSGVLILTDACSAPAWQADLRELLDEEFALVLPGTSLTSTPTHRAVVAVEALEQDPAWEPDPAGGYGMCVVDGSRHVTARRSKARKIVMALNPRVLLVLAPLPIAEGPADLHPLLSLLGVQGLPSPASLKRMAGDPDAPVTPELRSDLQPLLEPVMIRNTLASTKTTARNGELELLDVAPWPLGREIARAAAELLRHLLPSSAKHRLPASYWSMFQIGEAAGSSPWAVARRIDRCVEEGLLTDRLADEALSLARRAEKAQGDPRIRLLAKRIPDERGATLVVTRHRATAEAVVSGLKGLGLAVSRPGEPNSELARTVVTTDRKLPGPELAVDNLYHFDLPWGPWAIDLRAERYTNEEGAPPRTRILCSQGSPEAIAARAIVDRLDPASLQPGELKEILDLLPEEAAFPQILLRAWSSESARSGLHDRLDQELLGARREYRRRRDRNARLFLDDHAV